MTTKQTYHFATCQDACLSPSPPPEGFFDPDTFVMDVESCDDEEEEGIVFHLGLRSRRSRRWKKSCRHKERVSGGKSRWTQPNRRNSHPTKPSIGGGCGKGTSRAIARKNGVHALKVLAEGEARSLKPAIISETTTTRPGLSWAKRLDIVSPPSFCSTIGFGLGWRSIWAARTPSWDYLLERQRGQVSESDRNGKTFDKPTTL